LGNQRELDKAETLRNPDLMKPLNCSIINLLSNKGNIQMASEKTVNYTEAQTTALVQGYMAGETVEALAAQVGKTVRSVVAKLTREGVYKAKDKEAKATAQTKADLVKALEAKFEVATGTFESFEKATKEALTALVLAVSAD
jgi:branched-subunit amino acid permease